MRPCAITGARPEGRQRPGAALEGRLGGPRELRAARIAAGGLDGPMRSCEMCGKAGRQCDARKVCAREAALKGGRGGRRRGLRWPPAVWQNAIEATMAGQRSRAT